MVTINLNVGHDTVSHRSEHISMLQDNADAQSVTVYYM